jgi:poly-gamma-glutamate capsule biosynthesis protein CapA/YwtB (metallophosphatase superfamily)
VRTRWPVLVVAGVLVLAGCVMPPPEDPAAPRPRRTSPSPSASPRPASPSPSATLAGTPRPTATPAGTPRPTATRTPPADAVTLVLNGDLLWHNTLWAGAREDARRAGRRGFDFAPLLAGLRPVVAGADLAICHQEPPIAPGGGPYHNYPRFSVPPEVVQGIKATGYDVCTTASNHSLDRGLGGLKRTLDALDRAGIAHHGTARTPAEARRPTIVRARTGVRVAVISGTFSLNGIPKPAGKPWSVTGLDPDELLRLARRARADGAEIVVVAAHVGTEFSSRVNGQQRDLARRLTASRDVDLVYMHHTHVVQPWARVHGKWVIYGLGNTVAQHRTDVPQGAEGVTARLRFERGANGRFTVTRAEYIPTLVTRYAPGRPARLHQVSAALPKARGSFRARLRLAERRTTAVVTRERPAGLRRG